MTNKNRDIYLLIALLLISFFSVYYLPSLINRIVFLLLLISAIRSRYDYVYLVWFFIINDAPGRLFSGGTFDAVRIPLYPILPGVSISFQELFILFYLLKLLSLKRPVRFIFKKEFTWFYLFGVFVVLYSIPLGVDFDNVIRTFRLLFPWALVLILPAYFYHRKIVVRSSLLLFPMVFLALASQVYSYITGDYLDHTLRGISFGYLGLDQVSLSRSYSAMYILLFCIIQALYFFFSKKKEINRNYLGLVALTGSLSVYLSATRGWIIALSVMLIGIFFVTGASGAIKNWLRLGVIVAVLLALGIFQNPQIEKQMDATYQRLESLADLTRGDLTAGGTLRRLTERSPRVMKKFWESPVIGFGFSDEYYKYQDGHVGNQNLLLNVGILGYLLLVGIFIQLGIKIKRLGKKSTAKKPNNKIHFIYILGLITVFIIHTSSTQFWGYALSLEQTLFFGFFLAVINSILLDNRRMAKRSPAVKTAGLG